MRTDSKSWKVPNHPRRITAEELPTMIARTLTADDVEFEVEIEPEIEPIEGNASAIDPESDREQERWIYRQLARGNDYAWCFVGVVARWNGFEGRAGVGCCSYRSLAEIERDLLGDLRESALEDLNSNVRNAAEKLFKLL